jgi:hypothetical protein
MVDVLAGKDGNKKAGNDVSSIPAYINFSKLLFRIPGFLNQIQC